MSDLRFRIKIRVYEYQCSHELPSACAWCRHSLERKEVYRLIVQLWHAGQLVDTHWWYGHLACMRIVARRLCS